MDPTTDSAGILLVMAGGGGVRSMVIQLARRLTNLTVIATASREESRTRVEQSGGHHVVNHHNLRKEVAEVAPEGVHYIFSPLLRGQCPDLCRHHDRPRSGVATDEPEGLDILPLKLKSQTWHWDLILTQPLFAPASTAQRDLASPSRLRNGDAGADNKNSPRAPSSTAPSAWPSANCS